MAYFKHDPIVMIEVGAFLQGLLEDPRPLLRVTDEKLARVPEVQEWLAEVERLLRKDIRKSLEQLPYQ